MWKFLLITAEAPFKAIDSDGDGKVTLDEFVSYQLEYLYTTEDRFIVLPL